MMRYLVYSSTRKPVVYKYSSDLSPVSVRRVPQACLALEQPQQLKCLQSITQVRHSSE